MWLTPHINQQPHMSLSVTPCHYFQHEYKVAEICFRSNLFPRQCRYTSASPRTLRQAGFLKPEKQHNGSMSAARPGISWGSYQGLQA